MFGLEALGHDALIEGQVEDLSTRGMRAIIPAVLPDGARAFAVITPPDDLPIVAMIEVLEQTVLVAEVVVELRAQFVDLSEVNADRLRNLCAGASLAP
jgi:hypothetical protein